MWQEGESFTLFWEKAESGVCISMIWFMIRFHSANVKAGIKWERMSLKTDSTEIFPNTQTLTQGKEIL